MKYLLFLTFILFVSCTNNADNKKLISGKWRAASWLVKGEQSDYKLDNTGFDFNENGTYTFTYNGNEEKGTFIVKEDKLYTTPYEQKEIMVNIQKLTSDTLVFEMNRDGVAEQLTLIK